MRDCIAFLTILIIVVFHIFSGLESCVMPTKRARAAAEEQGIPAAEEQGIPKKKLMLSKTQADEEVEAEHTAEGEELHQDEVKCNNFPIYRRSSVPDVGEDVKGKLTTIAKAEIKGFKGCCFSCIVVAGPVHFPATDFQCGFCKEPLEASEHWQDGKMNCRGKYSNGARVQKHTNTLETFVDHPTKRRHCARGMYLLFYCDCEVSRFAFVVILSPTSLASCL